MREKYGQCHGSGELRFEVAVGHLCGAIQQAKKAGSSGSLNWDQISAPRGLLKYQILPRNRSN
jgi:hypothetical protein